MRKRAARALEHLFGGAKADGYTLKVVSAYRSYERQMQIYRNNVKTRGEDKTNKVSAMPGSSEHQTGLALMFRLILSDAQLRNPLQGRRKVNG